MFTGIIMDVGRVSSVRRTAYGARLAVSPGNSLAVAVSDSVAVNGVCLTVAKAGENLIEFDVVRETLERSTLKVLRPGGPVNLETAVPAGAPMGGHFVQGHVDSVCVVSAINKDVHERELRLKCPPEALRLIVEKGSVAVDGVSLTVSGLDDSSFTVKIVPYTWEATALRHLSVGDSVNVETDILAKYIARLLGESGGGLTLEKLRECGF
jgi:riboflavin synthase